MKKDALYPFGFGLSYTDYEVGVKEVKGDTLTDAGVDVTLTVKNAGKVDGIETLQAYVKVNAEKELKNVPNFSLKGISKVALKAGECKEVTMHLPKEAFGLFNEEGKLMLNKGTATVFVGDHAPDARSCKLSKSAVVSLEVKVEADETL